MRRQRRNKWESESSRALICSDCNSRLGMHEKVRLVSLVSADVLCEPCYLGKAATSRNVPEFPARFESLHF